MLHNTEAQKTNHPSRLKKRSAKFLVKKLKKNTIHYDWFTARARVKFNSATERVTFAVKMRIRKDSIIWLSFKKLNTEGLRVRIGPSRIEILNRIERQYIAKPISALQSEFNVNLNFYDLQELLIGNPIYLENNKFESRASAGLYILSKSGKELDLSLFIQPKSFLLQRISGRVNENTIDVELNNYKAINKSKIAHRKKIETSTLEAGEISLDMNLYKVILDEPQKTPFRVPPRYQIIE